MFYANAVFPVDYWGWETVTIIPPDLIGRLLVWKKRETAAVRPRKQGAVFRWITVLPSPPQLLVQTSSDLHAVNTRLFSNCLTHRLVLCSILT